MNVENIILFYIFIAIKIIFRYNNSLDLENNGSSRYSIIKKVNSVEFNVDSIDHVRNGIKKII